MCNGVLTLDNSWENDREYTLPFEKEPPRTDVWITVGERFSVKIKPMEYGIRVMIFKRGHEHEDEISSCDAFNYDAICQCEEHPWNK